MYEKLHELDINIMNFKTIHIHNFSLNVLYLPFHSEGRKAGRCCCIHERKFDTDGMDIAGKSGRMAKPHEKIT